MNFLVHGCQRKCFGCIQQFEGHKKQPCLPMLTKSSHPANSEASRELHSPTCVNVNAFAQVIDARDPLTYRSSDLEDYAHSISRHKGSMLLLNKSDLLPEVVLL